MSRISHDIPVRAQRQCVDCPQIIPAIGGKMRCAPCSEKKRLERLRERSKVKRQRRRQAHQESAP